MCILPWTNMICLGHGHDLAGFNPRGHGKPLDAFCKYAHLGGPPRCRSHVHAYGCDCVWGPSCLKQQLINSLCKPEGSYLPWFNAHAHAHAHGRITKHGSRSQVMW